VEQRIRLNNRPFDLSIARTALKIGVDGGLALNPIYVGPVLGETA
jgi:hypothetical protein